MFISSLWMSKVNINISNWNPHSSVAFCPWGGVGEYSTIFSNLPPCQTLASYLWIWSDHLQTLNITEKWGMLDRRWRKRTDGILGKITGVTEQCECKILNFKSHSMYRESQKKVYCDTGLDSKPITSLLYWKQPITIIHSCKYYGARCHDKLFSGTPCII